MAPNVHVHKIALLTAIRLDLWLCLSCFQSDHHYLHPLLHLSLGVYNVLSWKPELMSDLCQNSSFLTSSSVIGAVLLLSESYSPTHSLCSAISWCFWALMITSQTQLLPFLYIIAVVSSALHTLQTFLLLSLPLGLIYFDYPLCLRIDFYNYWKQVSHSFNGALFSVCYLWCLHISIFLII